MTTRTLTVKIGDSCSLVLGSPEIWLGLSTPRRPPLGCPAVGPSVAAAATSARGISPIAGAAGAGGSGVGVGILSSRVCAGPCRRGARPDPAPALALPGALALARGPGALLVGLGGCGCLLRGDSRVPGRQGFRAGPRRRPLRLGAARTGVVSVAVRGARLVVRFHVLRGARGGAELQRLHDVLPLRERAAEAQHLGAFLDKARSCQRRLPIVAAASRWHESRCVGTKSGPRRGSGEHQGHRRSHGLPLPMHVGRRFQRRRPASPPGQVELEGHVFFFRVAVRRGRRGRVPLWRHGVGRQRLLHGRWREALFDRPLGISCSCLLGEPRSRGPQHRRR
mmetsp:Transcript_59383/g.167296  ORF Transcript_59383/g.167296 Transcript_59383/m.167296 type:complete len:337 (+) Transcript_59383:89-1099(+)